MSYEGGFQAGRQSGGGNPFTAIISGVTDSLTKRRAMLDKMAEKDIEDAAALKKLFIAIGAEREAAEVKAKHEKELKQIESQQQEAIVDEKGNIVGYRPNKSVFQPKDTNINISSSDIQQQEKQVPIWEKFFPGKQKMQKRVQQMRETAFQQKMGGTTTQLPEGITEEDIQFTMKKYNLTREELLKRLGI